jgi:peptidoglycan/LPS O-acetylase OafA/YrhL
VLDGWRGLSILLVIAGHLFDPWYMNGQGPELYRRIAEVGSTAGVCIFFTISGYIITTLAFNEQQRTGSFSARAFYVRRFFRIVPPLICYLGVVVLLAASGLIVQSITTTLAAAAFTCNLRQMDCGWFCAHTWSLAYEEQYYVLFPILLLATGRRLRVVVGLVLASLLTLPFLQYEFHLRPSFLSGSDHAAYYFSFICAGVALAVEQTALRAFAGTPGGKAAVLFALIGFLGLLLLQSVSEHPTHRVIQALFLGRAMAPLCVAYMIGSSVWLTGSATRVLQSRPLQFVGLISYSLYLWQQLFTGGLEGYPITRALFFPPLMLVCAVMSYYFVEKPSVAFGKHTLALLGLRSGALPDHACGRAH